MGENRISEQVRQDVIDDAVVPGSLVGDQAAQRVTGGGKPSSKFLKLDVAPFRVYDVVVRIDRIDHLPQGVALSIRVEGFDRRIVR